VSRPRRNVPVGQSVTVDIAGEKHVLRSDASADYTRSVAGHVDAVIRSLPGFGSLEPFRAATLAALSITDQLFRAQDEMQQLRAEIDARTTELAALLEGANAATRPSARGKQEPKG
jgi:cell division protein ZapA (FtsZ GTPase activity inhibitor)